MKGWRVLDCCSSGGQICVRRGQLLIEPDNGEATAVPLADIAVLLVGQAWTISGAALSQLIRFGGTAMVVDWRGVPLCSSMGWAETTRVGARQIAQANCTLPRRKNAWGRIVREKVTNQARVLQMLGKDGFDDLMEYAADVRSGDPTNMEAQAARLYWSFLFDGHDFRRCPGEGVAEDISGRMNACLDYGYAVLRSHGVRAVLAAGLNPTLGLFHRGRSNRNNLVDDIIEPFRPLIDLCAAQMPVEMNLETPRSRHLLVAAASAKYSAHGRGADTELELFAQQLGHYYEGEIELLTVPQWVAPPLEAEL